MAKIKIIIADGNFLVRKGMEALLADNEDLQLIAEAQDFQELLEKTKLFRPQVLIIDYSSMILKMEHLDQFIRVNHLNVLAITPQQAKDTTIKALGSGILSYLLKDCGEEEIMEAIYKTSKGERFLCGKVLNLITDEGKENFNFPSYSSCEGVKVSDREMEIIKLIAEGYANKQIADKLFLSTHTVTTHRKNIMSKLNINNTAGIVLFAVRENLVSPNKYLFSN